MAHPGLLAALGRNRHSGRILITNGNYPVTNDTLAAAERIFLSLALGLFDVTWVLEILKRIVPIEKVGLMVSVADAVGIEALEAIPAHDEYRVALPGVTFDEIPRWDFYDTTKAEGVTTVIVSADQRLCANPLLIIGACAPGE